MFVRWCIIVLLLIRHSNQKCVKNKIQLWSPIKCEAGRSFFARLSTAKGPEIPQPYLFPWLAQLDITAPGRVLSCTGALINDRYVLTAQSCFLPPVLEQHVIVHVGFYNGYNKDLSEIFQPRLLETGVEQIIKYPSYDPANPQTAANNLALAKLSNPAKYSKTIYPVELPAPGDTLLDYSNTLAENMEWSFFPNAPPESSKKFKDMMVTILNEKECSGFNDDYGKIIKPGMICSMDAGNKAEPCGIEHGGLLTISKSHKVHNISILVGITAWEPSTPCSNRGSPSVYVRIDNKLPWIKANTLDAQYCRY